MEGKKENKQEAGRKLLGEGKWDSKSPSEGREEVQEMEIKSQ